MRAKFADLPIQKHKKVPPEYAELVFFEDAKQANIQVVMI